MTQAPLALTMGEPAGIGGEIMLKTWHQLQESGPAFFVIDDPRRLAEISERLNIPTPLVTISEPGETLLHQGKALPVLPIGIDVVAEPGTPRTQTAEAVLQSIAMAVDFSRDGHAGAVVTNPIQKSVLKEAGFRHPGHTEYLGELAGPGTRTVMMLAGPDLRVVPVTVHIPLARVPHELTTDLIVETGRITAEALRRDFGIAAPRLALAGLNPHAGENGMLGSEDAAVVAPAVKRLCAEGIDASGPLPGDTMFHERARKRYDAALCMYHDQALIPLKTLAFDDGVNTTLGLPFVRTSPDHGTALDIAGKNQANPSSFIEAIRMAQTTARNRARRA
ncbi:MAG: 4-hydroxythreonine-4-phosphate dehydrogenase PdxA [Rhodospirillaceae bacterium]|nr:4-hydroxythreonine-4-phosphate dehydrogenase PdxA [Rhodospirillaceae bacterium]